MTQTFEEMCAERDPLYAAMKPADWYLEMVSLDANPSGIAKFALDFLIYAYQARPETVRGLRTISQPYHGEPDHSYHV